MTARIVVLGAATILVSVAAALVMRGDLANDPRPRIRVVIETVVPVAGAALLVWLAWRAV